MYRKYTLNTMRLMKASTFYFLSNTDFKAIHIKAPSPEKPKTQQHGFLIKRHLFPTVIELPFSLFLHTW